MAVSGCVETALLMRRAEGDRTSVLGGALVRREAPMVLGLVQIVERVVLALLAAAISLIVMLVPVLVQLLTFLVAEVVGPSLRAIGSLVAALAEATASTGSDSRNERARRPRG
ncbi:hypothetical protein GCM10009814_05470 [Lapillicoccus jejuensis]